MRILVVDDDPIMLRATARTLAALKLDVATATDGADALDKLAGGAFDLVLSDLSMPNVDGFQLIAGVRERHPDTPVVIMTASSTVQDAVTALRAGAVDFLMKPFGDDQLESVVKSALAYRKQPAKNSRTRAPAPARPQAALVGSSKALDDVLRFVNTVGPSDGTVLVTGESGTGKEVVARLLHGASARASAPWVAINCGAIPHELVEGELFGYGRGAFTGATDARAGRFAQADGGTIFLDEVGELPPAIQVKLLRVLQEREITPLGLPARSVDVRIIAATNRDLEKMVQERLFREDLYYRLAVLPLELPPLRARAEDVPQLASHFLEIANRRTGRRQKLTPEASAILTAYGWPGNVRELENVIDRLSILVPDERIDVAQLPPKIRAPKAQSTAGGISVPDEGLDLPATLAHIERQLIEQALHKAAGNKTKAAELLGLNRTTLGEKLKRIGID